MNKSLLKDKVKAMSIHLGISSILAIICYVLINYIWYPSPLFKATGVMGIFVMMMGIDLVLGPLLTFIVYKKPKKTLKMDLMVIAIIQLAALIYGLYSIYQTRPVWITYVVDRFELVRANEIIEDPDYVMKLSNTGPQYAYVEVTSKDQKELFDNLFVETAYRISPAQRPKFYKNFSNAKPHIINHSIISSKLNDFNDKHTVQEVLKNHPTADSFLPLKTNGKDMTVLINKKEGGKVVKIVDLHPWKN